LQTRPRGEHRNEHGGGPDGVDWRRAEFVLTLLAFLGAAMRISGGMPTGLGIVDHLLSPRPTFTVLRVVLVLLSIGAGYMCFRTGDLGAKAVWQGRIQAARGGGLGGPGGQGLFSPLALARRRAGSGVADPHADGEWIAPPSVTTTSEERVDARKSFDRTHTITHNATATTIHTTSAPG
jgi:hypothetical protein